MDGKAFERTGLVPRSIIRTFNRFLQQLEPDAKTQAVQEFRISRYQVLVSVKSLIILFIVPIIVNISSKAFLFEPLVRYIWNSKQHDIFLNSYQENRAFLEMEDFSERMFFESLIQNEEDNTAPLNDCSLSKFFKKFKNCIVEFFQSLIKKSINQNNTSFAELSVFGDAWNGIFRDIAPFAKRTVASPMPLLGIEDATKMPLRSAHTHGITPVAPSLPLLGIEDATKVSLRSAFGKNEDMAKNGDASFLLPEGFRTETFLQSDKVIGTTAQINMQDIVSFAFFQEPNTNASLNIEDVQSLSANAPFINPPLSSLKLVSTFPMSRENTGPLEIQAKGLFDHREGQKLPSNEIYKDSLIKKKYSIEQETIDLDFQREVLQIINFYNNESIQSICNILGESLTLLTIAFLLTSMKTQMIILKSFLTESFYSLNDTTKSFLIILITDLLVGFHSPRGWEISLETILKHFGLPENQDFIFLFVATFPVFLDTIFKYWVFRYLNKISPSTVATYHNMIE